MKWKYFATKFTCVIQFSLQSGCVQDRNKGQCTKTIYDCRRAVDLCCMFLEDVQITNGEKNIGDESSWLVPYQWRVSFVGVRASVPSLFVCIVFCIVIWV